MLTILLLLAQASCEWVEIDQQHYEKPIRPTHNHPALVGEVNRSTKTSANRVYINQSLQEYNWNQGTGHRDHSINVQRVQLDTDTVKPLRSKPERNVFIEKPIQNTEIANYDYKNEIVTVIPKPDTVKRNRIVFGHSSRDTFNVKRLNPVSNGEVIHSRPQGDYEINKELEVFNLSDIRNPTGEDIFTLAVDDASHSDKVKHRLQFSDATPTRGTKEIVITPLNFETTLYEHENDFTSEETVKNEDIEDTIPKVFKINKMRRVEILRSTEKSPAQFVISPGSLDEEFERPVRRRPNLGIITKVQLPNNTSRITTERNIPYDAKRFVTKIPTKVSSEIITKDLLLNQAKKSKNIPQRSQAGRTHPRGTAAKPKVDEENNENYGFIKQHKVSNHEDVTEEIIVDREKDFSVHLMGNVDDEEYHDRKHKTGQPNRSVTRHYGPIKTIKVPDPEEVMVEEILKDEQLTNAEVPRGPNKGSVKRVQHPMERDKFEKIRRVTNTPVVPLKVVTTEEPFEYESEDLDGNIYSTPATENMKRHFSSTEKIPVITIERPSLKKKTSTFENPSFSPDTENYKHNIHCPSQKIGPFEKQSQSPETENYKHNLHRPSQKIAAFENPSENPETGNYEHNLHRPSQIQLESIPEFVTKEKEEDDEHENDSHNTERDMKITVTPTQPTFSEYDRINPYIDRGDFESTTLKEDLRIFQDTSSRSHVENNMRDSTMENVVKLLKVVTETISRNAHRSISSKMRYLQDLKDTIVANIEERIESLFPDDPDGTRRQSRSARAQSRGHHVEFPSSEGALMTISFLTFAVFLIKLVLQLINMYQTKTMMVMPTMVAAVGRAAFKNQRNSDDIK